MNRSRPARKAALPLVLVAAAALLLAACGSDDQPSASSATTAGSGTTIASPGTTIAASNATVQKFDRLVQQQLKDVGCYTGAVDGILGPQTDAAVVAFQTASGITVDGEIGPQTEAALAKATAEKKTVCQPSPGTTSTPPTTKAPTPTDPPCSATALAKALPSGFTVNTFVCSDVYAGVQGVATSGGPTEYYVLEWTSQDGGQTNWIAVTACGTASAGIPPQVLATGCKPN
jgi:peptidoglycan hydrolase-like protein with peptidoglycan-binding domain